MEYWIQTSFWVYVQVTVHPVSEVQAQALKPAFHITAPYGWMNDPNGMFSFMTPLTIAVQLHPSFYVWQAVAIDEGTTMHAGMFQSRVGMYHVFYQVCTMQRRLIYEQLSSFHSIANMVKDHQEHSPLCKVQNQEELLPASELPLVKRCVMCI